MIPNPNFKREIVIDWDEIRETYFKIRGGERHPQSASAFLHNLPTTQREADLFYGATGEQMDEWLHNGFTSDEIQGADLYVKDIHLPEQIWDEEGENVDVCAALSGDDEPFVEWEDLPSKPGIRVVAELAFLGGTQPSVIAEYGAWLAGALANLEGEGVDVELDVAHPSAQNLVENDSGSSNQMIVRIKRAGEVRDFADYSALFSPGGFRILGFTARFIACQKWGVTCSSGFGRSTNRSWDIDWDPTDRTLYITRPAQPSNFPAEMMTAKLAEVMGD